MINNKQEWEDIRSQYIWPVSLFFQFYKEKGGYLTDILEFERTFYQFFYIPRNIVHINMSTMQETFLELSFGTAVCSVINHFNDKYKDNGHT